MDVKTIIWVIILVAYILLLIASVVLLVLVIKNYKKLK